ncbi:PLAC8 family protein [Rutstroemia sp. NJR-2017a BBW]|nr:PLAC8 family protein [Rutstroemia sp. NJR-2017a BBW]
MASRHVGLFPTRRALYFIPTYHSKVIHLNDLNPGLKAYCLPCIVYGKTQHRLQNPSLAGYQTLNNDCCIWSAAQYCGLGCILTLLQRQAIRQKYGIPGDTLEDGFFSWCCHCCALMQQEKEVEQRNGSGNGLQQGYVRPEGMEMRPQY